MYVTSALVFTNLMKGKIISHIIEVISKTPRMQTMLNQPSMTKKLVQKIFLFFHKIHIYRYFVLQNQYITLCPVFDIKDRIVSI